MLFTEFSHPTGFFARKIDRKSDWAAESNSLGDIVKGIFPLSLEDKYSLYWIEDDRSLNAFLSGMIFNRQHLQNIDLLTFTFDELKDNKIELIKTPGDTLCKFANELHVDIVASIQQLNDLCMLAKTNDRQAKRVSKKKVLKPLKEALIKIGCCTPDCDRCKSPLEIVLPC